MMMMSLHGASPHTESNPSCRKLLCLWCSSWCGCQVRSGTRCTTGSAHASTGRSPTAGTIATRQSAGLIQMCGAGVKLKQTETGPKSSEVGDRLKARVSAGFIPSINICPQCPRCSSRTRLVLTAERKPSPAVMARLHPKVPLTRPGVGEIHFKSQAKRTHFRTNPHRQ